jgi:DNA invertase Pin-like site-specific DNA recombinase
MSTTHAPRASGTSGGKPAPEAAPGAGALIGYARCSTTRQDLTAQRQQLEGLGVPSERIYLDKGLTGTNRSRPGLDQALAAVRAGDTLVVTRLDRLARSVPDALEILSQLADRQVRFALGGAIYDWGDPLARMFLQILAVVAEFETNLLKQRTREGMAIARARGKLRGKPPKLSARQQAHLVKLHTAGEHSISDLAELFSVSRATVYRVLDRARATTSTAAGAGGGAADAAAALGAEDRPLPDLTTYDELLPTRRQSHQPKG